MKNPRLITIENDSHVEIGDPFILRFNGKYYLYCSTCDDIEGIRCFISDDLTAWKRITEIVVRKKMLDPDKRFVKKITIPELQNQIAIIGLTPGKTFTLTFENVLSDEIKVDSKLIDRLKNQGYFSQISRICKK